MDYPAIVEERDSERDLVHERLNRRADYGWVVAVHGLELRPNDSKHQYIVFSVWALYLKNVQRSEDTI